MRASSCGTADAAAFDARQRGVHAVRSSRRSTSPTAGPSSARSPPRIAATGRVDILVNNAGINGPVHPTWEYPPEAWDQVVAVDLTGVFHCCRAVVPTMRAAGYGRIVNVASIAGKEGGPGISAYAAAKGGVIAFTKSLAKELTPSNVLVNAIAPVITETDLFKEMTPEHITAMKAKIPMGRFLRIDEIAAMVAWIASPECSFTTGATFDFSGGRATY